MDGLLPALRFEYGGGSFFVSLLFIIIDKVRVEGNTCTWYRWNERPKSKTEGSKRFGYTGFREGRRHLKIETRLRGERFESVSDSWY